MAYSEDVRAQVRNAYIFESMSIDKAAMFADVKPQTALRWRAQAKKVGDDWDKLRDAHLIVGKGASNAARTGLTSLMVLIQSTIERINDNPDLDPLKAAQAIASVTDSLHKTMLASKRLLPESSELVIAMAVIEDFILFLQTKHKKLLPSFIDVLTDFGSAIEKKYGGKG